MVEEVRRISDGNSLIAPWRTYPNRGIFFWGKKYLKWKRCDSEAGPTCADLCCNTLRSLFSPNEMRRFIWRMSRRQHRRPRPSPHFYALPFQSLPSLPGLLLPTARSVRFIRPIHPIKRVQKDTHPIPLLNPLHGWLLLRYVFHPYFSLAALILVSISLLFIFLS